MADETLKPGPELDALVAEKVMGWRYIGAIDETERDYFETTWDASCVGGSKSARKTIHTRRFRPSVSINDALNVANEVTRFERFETRFFIALSIHIIQPGQVGCRIYKNSPGQRIWEGDVWIEEVASTAPHAICLAALRAVGAIE